MRKSVLSIRDLSLGYRLRGRKVTPVVQGVSLDLFPGTIVGLAGESGSGKSTFAKAAIGWRDGNSVLLGGSVDFRGNDLLRLPKKDLRALWGAQLAYVPQEVVASLNPARRVGPQLDEVLRLHTPLAAADRRERIFGLLARVGIEATPATLDRYPFEFSGGQQQRIALTLAMLCEPAVLILDEPTTGIDASLRREVLKVLQGLLAERSTAVIYISHDLAETAAIADELAIMYAGEIVEYGSAGTLFANPVHPYSAALRAAVPNIQDDRMVQGIPGRPPGHAVTGFCAFADRCDFVIPLCRSASVPLIEIAGSRLVRCVRAREPDLLLRDRRGELLSPREDFRPPSLLELRDVTCVYHLPRTPPYIAVSNVSLTLHASETVGVVGESGSGKSTLLRTIVGLHSPAEGSILLNGEPLPPGASERTHSQHRSIQLVFQNPDRSLNPRHSVRRILTAPLRLFEPELPRAERDRKIAELMASVQLPTNLLDRFPHQLSGGEKQRVALARAFAANPRLLLCDEVVSALDVSVQAEVMKLIRSYTQATRTAVIFVTHDLAVVRMMSDRVVVMRNGRVLESASTRAIFESPSHPYTMQLLAAVPRPDSAVADSARLTSTGRL